MIIARAAAFFRWWKDELLSFVPARLQELLEPQQALILLAVRGNQLIMCYCRNANSAGMQELSLTSRTMSELRGSIRRALDEYADEKPVFALDLPADWLLTKSLSLPAAAAEDVRQAMRYEMERRTPFKSDEVYYDVQALGPSADESRIDVVLHVVPRKLVDASVEALSSLGVRPDRIGFAVEGASAADGFNVLPREQARSGLQRNTLITAGLGVTAALLLFIAVSVSLGNKKKLADDLQAQVSALRVEVAESVRLESEIDRLAQRSRFIRERKSTRPAAVTILDELTRLLPDDTWLYNMRIRGGKVTIEGRARRAASLVGLIEDSPRFLDASMASQVTRDRKTNKDQFRLTFRLVNAGR